MYLCLEKKIWGGIRVYNLLARTSGSHSPPLAAPVLWYALTSLARFYAALKSSSSVFTRWKRGRKSDREPRCENGADPGGADFPPRSLFFRQALFHCEYRRFLNYHVNLCKYIYKKCWIATACLCQLIVFLLVGTLLQHGRMSSVSCP